jgi:Ser/Thr protein kinase RdoA (MazF antagonist)
MDVPDYPDLKALFRANYWDSANIEIQSISKGVENQNYTLRADGRDYILRIYSAVHATTGVRRRQDIEFELDFIEYLRGQAVPIPEVIHTRDGSRVVLTTINSQAHAAVLFEYIKGEEAASYNAENARSVAELLLKIRHASLGYKFRDVRKWPGNIIELSLKYYTENRRRVDRHRDELDALFENTLEGYSRIKNEALPTGIVHGDIKLENVLFESNTVKAILDFDDYRESYLLEDLTRTVMHDLESTARNVIRSGNFGVFQELFEKDPSVLECEKASLGNFLKARFIYDVTVYSTMGYNDLVEDLFKDQHIAGVIFT